MKAVIVDIEGKYAVALNKNGEFIRIRNNGEYKVGYEYDIEKHFPTGKVAKIASIAAAFALIVGIGAGVYSYNMPYSYVGVEINPSVEITANIFDRIINVQGLNDDGQQLLPPDGVKNRVLQEGIDIILANAVEQGYLKKDEENAIIITVSAKDSGKAGKLEERIETVATEKLQSYSVESEILIEEIAVDKKHMAEIESREYGITPGKMNLINKLLEKDSDLRIDDLKDKPVKDIMKSIKELRNEAKDNKKNDGDRKDILNESAKGKDKPSKDKKQNSSNIKSNSSDSKKDNKDSNKDKDNKRNNEGNNKNNKDNGKADIRGNNKDNKDKDDKLNNKGNNKGNKDDGKADSKGNKKADKDKDDKLNNKGRNIGKKDDDKADSRGNNKDNKDKVDNRNNKGNNKDNKDKNDSRSNRNNNKRNIGKWEKF